VLGDGQPVIQKLNYVSPVKRLESPLRAAKMVLVDPGADSAEVERCDNAYEALIKAKK
jgi:iron(III) transport system substrate-binding protein